MRTSLVSHQPPPDWTAERRDDSTRPDGSAPIRAGSWPSETLVGQVRRAIGSLQFPERQTVLWYYFEDWTIENIAGQLGMPVEEVNAHFHRALMELRAQLGAERCLVPADPRSDSFRDDVTTGDLESAALLDGEQRGVREMTDKQLREEILAELEFEPAVNAEHVGVSVDHGVVTLTGYVDSYGEKLAAERATRRVYSAKAVADDLQVKLPSRDEVPDTALARAAVQALQDCVQVPRDAVRLTVRDGHLYLEGKVDWQFQKRAAEEAVRHLRGLRGMVNHLEVRPQVSASDVKGQIESALRRSAEVESSRIQVETVDGKVILRGQVHSWHEQEEAIQAAWRAPGVTCVEDELVLHP